MLATKVITNVFGYPAKHAAKKGGCFKNLHRRIRYLHHLNV